MAITSIDPTEAIIIRDALKLLVDTENADAQSQDDADMAIAQAWFDAIRPLVPTTRDEALANYNFIKDLKKSETDPFRIRVLGIELVAAEQKYKDVKKGL